MSHNKEIIELICKTMKLTIENNKKGCHRFQAAQGRVFNCKGLGTRSGPI